MSLLILLYALIGVPHEYHVSITNIKYNEQTKKFEISQKLFVDDLEAALELEGTKVLFGDDPTEGQPYLEAQQYVKSHFKIFINSKKIALKCIGAEWENAHAIYFYWESDELPPFVSVEIFNDIFTEVSSDQQNMHYFKHNGIEESLLLEKHSNQGVITL